MGILVFVHELGHFLLAKRLGVGVLTFSFGFGPKLIGKKIGETEYQISAVPLGGFVKLIGENPEEEVKEEDRPRSFSVQPIWKRALIVSAGPVFNFFLAAVLFSTINLFGIPFFPSKMGEVSLRPSGRTSRSKERGSRPLHRRRKYIKMGRPL